MCQQVKKYRDNNPDKLLQRNRKYRTNNEKKVKEYNKKYFQFYKEKYPEAIKANSSKQRAKRKCVEGVFTKIELIEVYNKQDGKCFYCDIELNNKYHADHFIPIAKGGLNYISNIVCSCSTCNFSKNDKFPEEFFKYNKDINKLKVK